jgi:hypothetical protein
MGAGGGQHDAARSHQTGNCNQDRHGHGVTVMASQSWLHSHGDAFVPF